MNKSELENAVLTEPLLGKILEVVSLIEEAGKAIDMNGPFEEHVQVALSKEKQMLVDVLSTLITIRAQNKEYTQVFDNAIAKVEKVILAV